MEEFHSTGVAKTKTLISVRKELPRWNCLFPRQSEAMEINNSTSFWETKPTIHEYDLDWPHRYLQLKEQLESLFGTRILGIHHMGSTAVPGMAGKSIIDIKLAINLPLSESDLVSLRTLGFMHRETPSIDLSEYIRFDRNTPVDACLHLTPSPTSEDYLWTLKMTIFLPTRPDLIKKYSETKKEITQKEVSMLEYRTEKQGVLQEISFELKNWWLQMSIEEQRKVLLQKS